MCADLLHRCAQSRELPLQDTEHDRDVATGELGVRTSEELVRLGDRAHEEVLAVVERIELGDHGRETAELLAALGAVVGGQDLICALAEALRGRDVGELGLAGGVDANGLLTQLDLIELGILAQDEPAESGEELLVAVSIWGVGHFVRSL